MIRISHVSRLDGDVGIQVCELLDAAFSDRVYSNNTRQAFCSNHKGAANEFVLARQESRIVAVAIMGMRRIRFLGGTLNAATVGPVAVHPEVQRCGIGTRLMARVDQVARHNGAAVVYLQGIDGFYGRFGYCPCLAKSKVVVDTSRLPTDAEVECVDASSRHIDAMSALYDELARCSSCSALRPKATWSWLTSAAKETWYFYHPVLITRNGQPIAYFCSDPAERGRIREVACLRDLRSAQYGFAGISRYAREEGIGTVQVMTWYGSPLYRYAQTCLNATFMQFIRTDASQLMKILNPAKIRALVEAGLGGTYSVRMSSSGDRTSIEFTARKRRKSHRVSVQSRHLPGLLSGYYPFETIAEIPRNQRLPEDLLKYWILLSPPFIFQGDNF